jgi:putative membrane protein insertion efficiency factor
MKVFKFIFFLPRYVLVFLVFIYQKTISPDHGILKVFFPYGYCKYNPTCSDYAKQTIMKHGAILGGLKALWRVLKCNPWSKGGDDPV